MKRHIIKILLVTDLIILVLGVLNLLVLTDKAGLPKDFNPVINNFTFDIRNIYKSEKIIEFDGHKIGKRGLLDIFLLYHRSGDEVKIKLYDESGKVIERTITLPRKFNLIELIVMSVVTLFYFFTGIFILLRYRNSTFSYIIHCLTISTGIMIILDWGDLITYNIILNYITFIIFESSIYLVPTLFLHFSFTYPFKASSKSLIYLTPFYCASGTFIVIAFIQLTNIFFFGKSFESTYFIDFHNTVSDIYLVILLLLTVAKLEHSALIITDITFKKQIYWALLGISFGPLIYVFMRLIPRLIMGYELVSMTFMEFTTIVAPIMFLISVTRNKRDYI